MAFQVSTLFTAGLLALMLFAGTAPVNEPNLLEAQTATQTG